jgi:cell division FtsZ-interacting protein ZapD
MIDIRSFSKLRERLSKDTSFLKSMQLSWITIISASVSRINWTQLLTMWAAMFACNFSENGKLDNSDKKFTQRLKKHLLVISLIYTELHSGGSCDFFLPTYCTFMKHTHHITLCTRYTGDRTWLLLHTSAVYSEWQKQ